MKTLKFILPAMGVLCLSACSDSNVDTPDEMTQKEQTLKHELMHCYIGCYLFNSEKEYTEEDLCNISANSHDIIHEIVKQYFNCKKHSTVV